MPTSLTAMLPLMKVSLMLEMAWIYNPDTLQHQSVVIIILAFPEVDLIIILIQLTEACK